METWTQEVPAATQVLAAGGCGSVWVSTATVPACLLWQCPRPVLGGQGFIRAFSRASSQAGTPPWLQERWSFLGEREGYWDLRRRAGSSWDPLPLSSALRALSLTELQERFGGLLSFCRTSEMPSGAGAGGVTLATGAGREAPVHM